MKWVFDLVIAYFQEHGLAVHRGFAAAFDFEVGDFVLDGAWHELDLSPFIPENVTIVYLFTEIQANQAGLGVWFANPSGGPNRNRSVIQTLFGLMSNYDDIQIFPTVDRKIFYVASPGLTRIRLTVKGWDF